jgi:hypothetical protein
VFLCCAFALVACAGTHRPTMPESLPFHSTLPAPTLTPSDEPTVLIHEVPGNKLVRAESARTPLDVAVWSDGRIVWRRDRGLLQGRIDKAKLLELLERLHAEGVFGACKSCVEYYGPDADFEVIEVRTADRELRLASWHEASERDSRLVGTVHGLESFGGRNREDVLAAQPDEYRRFRRIWSDIHSTVMSWIPQGGELFTGAMPAEIYR